MNIVGKKWACLQSSGQGAHDDDMIIMIIMTELRVEAAKLAIDRM